MAIPVGSRGTSTTYVPTKKSPNPPKRTVDRAKRQTNDWYRRVLSQSIGSGGPGPGGPSGPGLPRGGTSGGGSGGGSGPSAYEKWLIEQEKERQQRLENMKKLLTSQLQGARKQALPLLEKYNKAYGKDIKRTFGQNRRLNKGYTNQLNAIANQMRGGARAQYGSLRRDLQGQGAGAPDLQALMQGSNANMQGIDFINMLGKQYNTRLAQVMAQRQADAGAMGAAVRASSKGNLENSYANLLGQIGLIGLTG